MIRNNKSVVQVTRYFYPISGGQQIYIDALNKVLKRNNFTPYVIQPHVFGVEPPENVIYTKPIPFLYRFSNYLKNFEWFLFNFELKFLKRQLLRFDIIISHYSFHLPVLSSFNNCIVVSHGVLWSENEHNYFNYYLKKTDLSLSCKRKNITIVANDTDFLARVGFSMPAHTSPFTQIQKGVWYIPNCVDTDEFKRNEDIVKEKIIFLARNIREDRGIHLAISSFVEFEKFDPSYRMIIAGTPLSGTYFNYCKNLIAENKIEDKVIFLGFTNKEQIKHYYQKSMLTLVPSLEKEGTSLSALESMACGTPVVATNIGGLKDLPCVLAQTNATDIAEKMIEVVKNWNCISKYQSEIVKSTFNISNWEQAWINVINTKVNNDK